MGRIEDECARSLFQSAQKDGDINHTLAQATQYMNWKKSAAASHPETIGADSFREFLEYTHQSGQEELIDSILKKFSKMALASVGLLNVEVVSAVPLSQDQLSALHIKLVQRSKKNVQLTHRVDSSLIAGLRLVADGVVMDTSVKRELAEMKKKFYKEVHSFDENKTLGNQLTPSQGTGEGTV